MSEIPMADLVIRKEADAAANEASWNGIDLMRDLPGVGLHVEYRPRDMITAKLAMETSTDVEAQVKLLWFFSPVAVHYEPRRKETDDARVPICGFTKDGEETLLSRSGLLKIRPPADHAASAHFVEEISIDGEKVDVPITAIDLSFARHFEPACARLVIAPRLQLTDELLDYALPDHSDEVSPRRRSLRDVLEGAAAA